MKLPVIDFGFIYLGSRFGETYQPLTIPVNSDNSKVIPPTSGLLLNMLNLDDSLSTWAELKPDGIAFADENRVVSFLEVNQISRKIANVLTQSGILRGDLVCMVLPAYHGWLVTMALQLMGVTTMSKNSITPFAPEAMPDWFISIKPHPEIPVARSILIDEKYAERVKSEDEIAMAPGYSESTDIAGLFSTSGTSGTEKYIALDAGAMSEMVLEPWAPNFPKVEHLLSLFPFGALWPFMDAVKAINVGATFFSCGASDKRLPQTIDKYPIDAILASPAQIVSLLDIAQENNIELTRIRTVMMAGSAPSQQLLDRIKERLNCRVFNIYGSTEAGNIAMMDVTGQVPEGSVINPTVDLQIVDESDVEVARNTLGRMRYRKSGMSTSYYKNSAATAEFFKDGFFYPGDLALINGEGLLVLGGRSSEVINLGGVKINPEKVDEIAMAQLGVLDCAAFAITGTSGVESLAIALVTDADFDQNLFNRAMSQKSPHPPSISISVATIPRNDNGKVSRQSLRTEYEKANPASRS
jgi:long-chain acyl-CoA synthetase